MTEADSSEGKIRWFLLALYICDAVGALGADQKLKLAHLAEQYGGKSSWRKIVEEDHQIDKKMIAGIYNFATRQRSHRDCLIFILPGLGCPYPEARAQDAIGGDHED